MPAVNTVPANPRTQADIAKIVRAGVRDVNGAARFLGCSRSRVWRLLSGGELWSFRQVEEGCTRGKRLIPVSELRRYLAAVAMEGK
jgi:hypothetical protein